MSLAKAYATAGASSDGFHTIVLPVTSAGTIFHDGTAIGKLPAVTMPTTPSGRR
jgi:hypothetical protein